MNAKDLESIKTRLGKATAGEWENIGNDVGVVGTNWGVGWPPSSGTIASLDDGEYIENLNAESDADFIAHSKQDIESLLGEVGRLQNKIDSMTTITVEADTVKLHTQIQELQQENSRLKTMNYALSQGKVLELQSESQRYRTALEKIRDSQNGDDFHYLATRCAMEALR